MPISNKKIVLLKIYFFLIFWLIYFNIIPFFVVEEFRDILAFNYSILFILLFSLGFFISLYNSNINPELKIDLFNSYKLFYLYVVILIFSIAFHNLFTPLFAIISGHLVITRLELNKKYQAFFILTISSIYLFDQFTRMFILMFYLYIFMYYYLKSKKFYIYNIIIIAIASQFLLIVMLFRRVYGEVNINQILDHISLIEGEAFLKLIDNYFVYEAYLKVLNHFPKYQDYLYGITYLKPIIFWIPRTIWDDKPLGLSHLIVPMIYGNSRGLEYSTGFTLTGEAYINFGFIGVIFGSIILGYALGFVSKKMISTKNEYTFIISLTILIYFPHIARGGIIDITLLFLIIFYIIFLFFYKTKYLYKNIMIRK